MTTRADPVFTARTIDADRNNSSSGMCTADESLDQIISASVAYEPYRPASTLSSSSSNPRLANLFVRLGMWMLHFAGLALPHVGDVSQYHKPPIL